MESKETEKRLFTIRKTLRETADNSKEPVRGLFAAVALRANSQNEKEETNRETPLNVKKRLRELSSGLCYGTILNKSQKYE